MGRGSGMLQSRARGPGSLHRMETSPTMIRTRSSCLPAAWTAALALALLAGCGGGGSSKPVEPEVPVPPTPNSPVNAVRLLEWCWDHRDAAKYREVFANDYAYVFAASDSQSISTTLNRDEELQITSTMF